MSIGFSTGSLAGHDVRRGIQMALQTNSTAIELSALREAELPPLLLQLDQLPLDRFSWISVHAPGKRRELSEAELVSLLQPVASRGWSIIVHPDVIADFTLWQPLGKAVCIENMDLRKPIGRTAAQLAEVFHKLPAATFCLDIGHAHQVDPTMQEAEKFLTAFHGRLRQVHMSYVNPQSQHERLNTASVRAFRKVSHWLTNDTPIILEAPLTTEQMHDELALAERVFHGLSDAPPNPTATPRLPSLLPGERGRG